MRPEFSIVIPTFRRPVQLREALDSVAAQGDIPLEVVVVDDSPEGSAFDIVNAQKDSRISYIKNRNPSGGIPSLVRNIGLQQCSGDYIHFLDDDDIIPKGFYDKARLEIRRHSQIGVIFGEIEPFGECLLEQLLHEQKFFQEAFRRARICARLGTVWPFVGQMLFGHVLLVCSAAILKRDCVKAVGGFDTQIVLHEDRDLFVRLMRKFGARVIDCVSIRYRIGYPSLMHAITPTAEQLKLEREGNKRLKDKYLRTYGNVEYYSLAIATRFSNQLC